jgi:hypothetical protein
LQIRKPAKRSGGSIDGAADERSHATEKLDDTVHMSRVPSSQNQRECRFPTEIFEQLHHQKKINYFASSLAGVEGLEPPTPGFGDRCSGQLSYTPFQFQ